MLRNNADARRCSFFELGLPVGPSYVIVLSTSAYHLYRTPGISGENSNGTIHPSGNFPEKSNTFRGTTFSSFLPKRPKFSVPFQGQPTTVFCQEPITRFCKISVRRGRCCLEFSVTWGRLQISRWPFHSCTIFEAYLKKFLRFSKVLFFTFNSSG